MELLSIDLRRAGSIVPDVAEVHDERPVADVQDEAVAETHDDLPFHDFLDEDRTEDFNFFADFF